MNIWRYLKDQFGLIILWLFFLGLTSLILFLTPSVSFNSESMIYLSIIQFIFLFVYLGIQFFRKKHWWDSLENRSDDDDLLIGNFHSAITEEQRLAERYFNELLAAHQNAIEQILNKQQDQKDFIDSWVHEIKVPLASIQLLAELISEDIPEKNYFQLENDLKKIDDYVEQVLYFSRLDSFAKDYLIQEYSLKKIVQPVVRESANYFIQHKLQVSIGEQDFEVLTDQKWLSFILNQILSNALKYTPNGGKISIDFTKNQQGIWLLVTDTGIGIPLEDQRRIFDKGFTGTNGRTANHHSTGLGLYLARSLAEKLGHQIYCESEVGVGTTIKILFPFLTYYTEEQEEKLI